MASVTLLIVVKHNMMCTLNIKETSTITLKITKKELKTFRCCILSPLSVKYASKTIYLYNIAGSTVTMKHF